MADTWEQRMAVRAKERARLAIDPSARTRESYQRERDAEDLARYRATLRLGNVYLRQHLGWWGDYGWIQDPVTREHCGKCHRPNPDIAHVVLEYVAATLAEPLRRAVDQHIKDHGCSLFNCAEGERLWQLQPDGDTILLA